MNKIFLGIITSFLIFNIFLFPDKGVTTENSTFYSIIEAAAGEIIETSFKAVYYVEQSSEEEIRKTAEYFQGNEILLKKDENNIHLLNIIKDEMLIEIKGVDLKDKSQITIKTVVYGHGKKLGELEQYIQDYTKNKEVDAKYYKYMKGKLKHERAPKALESVNSALEKKGFHSIENLEIDNGYTSIAILNNHLFNDEIKINYSLCSYETSTYIFIGTPIIDEIY